MTSVDGDWLTVTDPHIDRQVGLPHRMRWLTRAGGWILFLVNLVPVAFYAVLVLTPWLPYLSAYGAAACSPDTGCAGPAAVTWPSLPGAEFDPLNWLLVIGAFAMYLIVASGPAASLILGASTVAAAGARLHAGRTVRRVLTLGAGILMLALGIFQTTPTGAVLATWLVG